MAAREGRAPARKASKSKKPEVPPVMLAELKRLAEAYLDADDPAALRTLANTPLTAVHKPDLAEARIWLLRMRIKALFLLLGDEDSEKTFSDEDFALLRSSVFEYLEMLTGPWHEHEEFEYYLMLRDSSIEQLVEAYLHLVAACQSGSVRLSWLRSLRDVVLSLVDKLTGPEQLSAAQQCTIARLPPMLPALEAAYAAGRAAADASSEQQAWCRVVQLELLALTQAPALGQTLAALVDEIPSPQEAELPALLAQLPDARHWQVHHLVTPQSIAFLLELAAADTRAQLSDVHARYWDSLRTAACRGLGLLAGSVLGDPGQADAALAQGVRWVSQFGRHFAPWCADHLAIELDGQAYLLYIGSQALRLPPLGDLVVRIASLAETSYPHRAELDAVARELKALTSPAEPALPRTTPGLRSAQGLSVGLELAGISLHPDFGRQVLALVAALQHSSLGDTNLGGWVPALDQLPQDAAQRLSQIDDALAALRQLSSVRSQLTREAERLWLGQVLPVFREVVSERERMQETLLLARAFQKDLTAAGGDFTLGYLEHVAGDPLKALEHYLASLARSERLESGLEGNLQHLINGLETPDVVDAFAQQLAADSVPERVQPALAPLLELLTERKQGLLARQALEASVATRWQGLSMPARQLLLAMVSAKSFELTPHLGTIAGMTQEWAQRHYSRLKREGFLIERRGKTQLNPLVPELLGQAAQPAADAHGNRHQVLRMTVQAQAQAKSQSAVRPLFSDQRRLTVYRLLERLCTGHIVAPEVSLQAIISYDLLKGRVAYDDFNYYLMARVDVAVVSAQTLLPLLAVDVNLLSHAQAPLLVNDERKNTIFEVAGIPLLRLRVVGEPSEDELRQQVTKHLAEFAHNLDPSTPGSEQSRDLLQRLSIAGT